MSRRTLPPTIKGYWPEYEAAVRARKDRKLLGLETGFASIDAKLSGLSGVTVLAGAPGAGKTTLVLQTAWQVAELNQTPVLYVSAEMFREQLMTKIVSRLATTPYLTVALGTLWSKGEGKGHLAAAKEAIDEVGDRFALLDRTDRTDLSDIRRYVKLMKGRTGADRALVVVDSLQMFTAQSEEVGVHGTTKDLLDRAMGDVYRAAYAEGFDVLMVSHIPKSAVGRIQQFVFSGSGGIDFGADCTMLLHGLDESRAERHEVVGVSGVRAIAPHVVKLTVLKHRFSPPCSIELLLHPAISSFREP